MATDNAITIYDVIITTDDAMHTFYVVLDGKL